MEKNKQEIKYQKVRVRNNKEIEMGEVKQISKQEKREERQFPHQRQLVIESIIDLDKIRETIAEKRYYQNKMKPSGPTYINKENQITTIV